MSRPTLGKTNVNWRLSPEAVEALKQQAIAFGFTYGEDGAAMGAFMEAIALISAEKLQPLIEQFRREDGGN